MVADWYIGGGNQTAKDTADVLAQIISDYLGDDFVKLEVKTYVTNLRTEITVPGYHSFVNSGWGADYADPVNFLSQEMVDSDNAYFVDNYTHANEAQEEVKALLREYTAMVNAADAITDDIDARYEAMADAEAFYLEHVLCVPTFFRSNLQLTSINPLLLEEKAVVDVFPQFLRPLGKKRRFRTLRRGQQQRQGRQHRGSRQYHPDDPGRACAACILEAAALRINQEKSRQDGQHEQAFRPQPQHPLQAQYPGGDRNGQYRFHVRPGQGVAEQGQEYRQLAAKRIAAQRHSQRHILQIQGKSPEQTKGIPEKACPKQQQDSLQGSDRQQSGRQQALFHADQGTEKRRAGAQQRIPQQQKGKARAVQDRHPQPQRQEKRDQKTQQR